MKLVVLLVIIFVSLGTYQLRVLVPEIGAKLPASVVPKDNRRQWLTASAQTRPYIEKEFENVKYVIAYDEETLEVKYLYTDDRDFWDSRGWRTGDYIEVKRDEVLVVPGWEVRARKDKDGWQPLIGFDDDGFRLPDGPVFKIRIKGFVKGGG